MKCRGTEFWKEFSNLGEVRSLIPEHVHCMALTATATKTSRKTICSVLGISLNQLLYLNLLISLI